MVFVLQTVLVVGDSTVIGTHYTTGVTFGKKCVTISVVRTVKTK